MGSYQDEVLMKSVFAEMETQELIDKLIKNGYGKIVDCLLMNESNCYTKRDRLNKSATCRQMKWKSKQLEETFAEMRELLQRDMEFGDEEEEESAEKKS